MMILRQEKPILISHPLVKRGYVLSEIYDPLNAQWNNVAYIFRYIGLDSILRCHSIGSHSIKGINAISTELFIQEITS